MSVCVPHTFGCEVKLQKLVYNLENKLVCLDLKV